LQRSLLLERKFKEKHSNAKTNLSIQHKEQEFQSFTENYQREINSWINQTNSVRAPESTGTMFHPELGQIFYAQS